MKQITKPEAEICLPVWQQKAEPGVQAFSTVVDVTLSYKTASLSGNAVFF